MKRKNYVSKDELEYEIIITKSKGKITPRLDQLLILIMDKYIPTIKYSNSIFQKEDIINFVYIKLNKKIFNYDEKRFDNPLAYVSELIKREVWLFHNTYEKNQLNNFSIDSLYSI